MHEQLRCPSGHLRIQNTTGNCVVACRIIINQHFAGQSNIEHWEIVPSNCLGDSYLECPVWRDEKDAEWKDKIGSGKKYSDIKQAERILL